MNFLELLVAGPMVLICTILAFALVAFMYFLGIKDITPHAITIVVGFTVGLVLESGKRTKQDKDTDDL